MHGQERIVYLNGDMVPESAAKISIFDRGFIWGDAVYDAGRTFASVPFKTWDHVERLYRSLRYVRIDIGLKKEELHELIMDVIKANLPLLTEGDDYLFRIHVSRGNMTSEGSVHEATPSEPTVAIFCMPINFAGYASAYRHGVQLITPGTRRTPAQSISPKVKAAVKLNNFVAAFEAKEVSPDAMPLLLDTYGYVTESSGANFMFISNETLCVPNRNNVLEGVSMLTVMEIAAHLGIPIEERDYTPYDVYCATEAFLTAGTFCVLPVASLNGISIGDELPGPVTRSLLTKWSEDVGVDIVQQAELMATRVAPLMQSVETGAN